MFLNPPPSFFLMIQNCQSTCQTWIDPLSMLWRRRRRRRRLLLLLVPFISFLRCVQTKHTADMDSWTAGMGCRRLITKLWEFYCFFLVVCVLFFYFFLLSSSSLILPSFKRRLRWCDARIVIRSNPRSPLPPRNHLLPPTHTRRSKAL